MFSFWSLCWKDNSQKTLQPGPFTVNGFGLTFYSLTVAMQALTY